jgi:hypothetical protein
MVMRISDQTMELDSSNDLQRLHTPDRVRALNAEEMEGSA